MVLGLIALLNDILKLIKSENIKAFVGMIVITILIFQPAKNLLKTTYKTRLVESVLFV